MSEYKFSNFFQKIMIFLALFRFSRRKLQVRNVTLSFSESLRPKIKIKTGVTWFRESTPLRAGGRLTRKQGELRHPFILYILEFIEYIYLFQEQ